VFAVRKQSFGISALVDQLAPQSIARYSALPKSKSDQPALTCKNFDRQFNAVAENQVLDMKCFFSTEEGRAYYNSWIKKNRKLQRQYESPQCMAGYNYDDEEDE